MKKKSLLLLLSAVLSFSLVACSNKISNDTSTAEVTPGNMTKIVVGADVAPHSEILNVIVDDLAAQNIELVISEFSDWKLLNPSLSDGQIDANFFQHQPYLDEYVANSGQDLVSVASVHIEPMGVYSNKITSLDELSDGDKVSLPNDATNEARALLLLESKGIIKLDENAGLAATPNDIVENPKNLEFLELQAAQLPRTLDEVAISIINTNYALSANLNPISDAIAIENQSSPYANILVVRGEDANNEAISSLCQALNSQKVRTFIEENYKGAIVPAF